MSAMKEIQTKWFTLHSTAAEGRFPRADFGVLEARPKHPGDVRGGLVLIQEIFGVNTHIRALAERYAAQGFAVWTPSLFDHLETGVALDYETRSFAKGRELVAGIGWEQPVEDLRLCAEGLAKTLPRRNVATLGFCWGGALSWLAACRIENADLKASVCYYGRQIFDFRHEKPRRPVAMHFGESDSLIPLANVDAVRATHPSIPVYVYPAGHGFNCDARADYNAEAAALAWQRNFEFLAANGI